MDYPGIWTQPLMISTVGRFGTLEPAASMLVGSASAGGGTFAASTGDVVLAPFTIPGPCLISSMWWYNGTTSSGNIDAGIYTVNTGSTTVTRLCSTGAIAQGTVSILQSANITAGNIRLEPGTYYLAIANSSTGNLFGRTISAATVTYQPYAFGWQTAATSGGSGTLATTLTAATWTGLRYPVFGFSRLPSGQY